MYVIRIAKLVGHARLGGEKAAGQYVTEYDPDAFGGRGHVAGSLSKRNALRFASVDEAMRFIQQPSTVRPLRADGEPNRPITAFTLIVEEAPER